MCPWTNKWYFLEPLERACTLSSAAFLKLSPALAHMVDNTYKFHVPMKPPKLSSTFKIVVLRYSTLDTSVMASCH